MKKPPPRWRGLSSFRSLASDSGEGLGGLPGHGGLADPGADALEVVLLGLVGLAEACGELVLAVGLREIDEEAPAVVVGQLGDEDGVEALGEGGARIEQDLRE